MTEDGEHATQILLQMVPHMGQQNAQPGEMPVQMAVETPGEEKVGIMVIQQEEVRGMKVGLSRHQLNYFWCLVNSGFSWCFRMFTCSKM